MLEEPAKMKVGKKLNDGILQVTNVRVLWRQMNEVLPRFNISRLNVENTLLANDEKSNRTVLKIELSGEAKEFKLIYFTGTEKERVKA